VVAITVGRGP